MLSIKSELDSRKAEIDLIINEVKVLEQSWNLLNEHQIALVSILKSTTYMMSYNLIEWVMNLAFDELYNVLKNENFTNLKKEFQQLVWENFCDKLSSMQKDKVIQTINKIIFSSNIKCDINTHWYDRFKDMRYWNFVWWNIDQEVIKTIFKKHQIAMPKQTPNSKCYYLKTIKHNRNSLAHGEKSFWSLTQSETIRDIESNINISINFVRSLIETIEKFLDERGYAIPTEYLVSVTFHNSCAPIFEIFNTHNERIYITNNKKHYIEKNIVYPKIQQLKESGLLKEGEQFFIHLDKDFNLISWF